MVTAYDILVVGGGAAGFFTAINAADSNPELRIGILERSNEVLSKVRVSGGGRCNVTHAEFDPVELATNYPRGNKELLGPFHHFSTGDTMEWLDQRGVELKIEDDGRVFPVSDSSQTIIDCFMGEANRLGIQVLLRQGVKSLTRKSDNWLVSTRDRQFSARYLVIATGSSKTIWKMLEGLGHKIVPPVPSLFTFNIDDHRIANLQGISTRVVVELLDQDKKQVLMASGPLLITHWGMSGPAILKISAWGARWLAKRNYEFEIRLNWLNGLTKESAIAALEEAKLIYARKQVGSKVIFDLPGRLWKSLVNASGIGSDTNWAQLKKIAIDSLAVQLTGSVYQVRGKSTFKDEFVTAGGIELKEVDFKTFESKVHRGLYFAGEVLDIDAITGGFNFQNAWTGGYLAALALSKFK